MPRRKTKKVSSRAEKNMSGKEHREFVRFGISFLVLSSILVSAVFLFLITLNISIAKSQDSIWAASNLRGASIGKIIAGNSKVSDPALNFELKMPENFGEWFYKIGYVKSITASDASNQYLKIYVPVAQVSGSKNFEEQYQEIISIRKFSSKEWSEIEKGCAKGNLLYCEEGGKKIGENEGAVYAYTAPKKCSPKTQSQCKNINKIIASFKMK